MEKVKVCHRLLAKALPDPTLTYCELDHHRKTSVKYESKHKIFYSEKPIWIYVVCKMAAILSRPRRVINMADDFDLYRSIIRNVVQTSEGGSLLLSVKCISKGIGEFITNLAPQGVRFSPRHLYFTIQRPHIFALLKIMPQNLKP